MPELVAQATEDDDLVDVAAVARMLGLAVNTTKRLPPGELPYFRVTSRGDRRYRLGDVRAYLAARRIGS